MVDNVLEYLKDPHKTGVHHLHVVIQYSKVKSFFEYLEEYAKKNRKRLRSDKAFFEVSDLRIKGKEVFYPQTIDKTLDDLLNFWEKQKLCSKKIVDWVEYGTTVMDPEYYAGGEAEGFFFFEPLVYFEDVLDAMNISINPAMYPDLVIDAVSLKQELPLKFYNFIKEIPKFDLTDPMINLRHSSTYVFRPYPAVAALWIDKMGANKLLSSETILILSGAIEYFSKREWQMSIILSAIAAENIIAELYEEVLERKAPGISLGGLMRQINDKKEMPRPIKEKIRIINGMRISAVHRGGVPLFSREAIQALSCTIQFAIWHYSEGLKFCTS